MRKRNIGCNAFDEFILRMQRLLADILAEDFDLGASRRLETLDDNEIDR